LSVGQYSQFLARVTYIFLASAIAHPNEIEQITTNWKLEFNTQTQITEN